MKVKIIFIIMIIVLFNSFIPSLGQNKLEWKGSVEYNENIKIIKNPQKSVNGEIKYELIEDLVIGDDRDDNYLFYKIRDVTVDYDGFIYVADMGNFRVQKFDNSGKYIMTIGREGQGPGEFVRPTIVRVDEKTKEIYVKDASIFIEIFDKDGNYIRSIKLSSLLGVVKNLYILGQKNLLLKTLRDKDMGKSVETFISVALLNHQGKVLKYIAEYPLNIQWIRKGLGGRSGFETELCFTALGPDSYILGFPKKYCFDIIDNEGNTMLRIMKKESRPKYNLEERATRTKIPFPTKKPFYYNMITDSKMRIYVQKNNTTLGGPIDRREKHVDVFSKDGHFLYKTILPVNTVQIMDGFLYAYIIDDNKGGEYVKRFRIKNWDQLITGIN